MWLFRVKIEHVLRGTASFWPLHFHLISFFTVPAQTIACPYIINFTVHKMTAPINRHSVNQSCLFKKTKRKLFFPRILLTGLKKHFINCSLLATFDHSNEIGNFPPRNT